MLIVIDGRPASVIAFTLHDGLITEIRTVPVRVRRGENFSPE
jgi:hypothetical protein